MITEKEIEDNWALVDAITQEEMDMAFAERAEFEKTLIQEGFDMPPDEPDIDVPITNDSFIIRRREIV